MTNIIAPITIPTMAPTSNVPAGEEDRSVLLVDGDGLMEGDGVDGDGLNEGDGVDGDGLDGDGLDEGDGVDGVELDEGDGDGIFDGDGLEEGDGGLVEGVGLGEGPGSGAGGGGTKVSQSAPLQIGVFEINASYIFVEKVH